MASKGNSALDLPAAARPSPGAGVVARMQQLLSSRERLFWFLHLFGWSGYALAAYLGALAHEKPVSYNLIITAVAISGLLLTTLLRYPYRALWNRSPLVLATVVLGLSYVAALIWRIFSNELYWAMYKEWYEPDSLTEYISGVTGSWYVLLCWSGLYFGIKYYQSLQEQQKQTLAATAMAHQAQLKMLRYQLNPHFLFNTLNAISTLILDRDNDTANLAVTRLSAFLRYTLDNDPVKRVTLKQELNALNLYLQIEQVRFAERLRLRFEIDDAALPALLPSLILQPLIENAVKYAVAPREEGGSIEIRAEVEAETLAIDITDDGPGLDPARDTGETSRGVGLRNTRERLRQLYGEAHRFSTSNVSPSGLKISIRIPYER